MSIADAAPIGAFGALSWVDRGLSYEAGALRKLTISAAEFRNSVTLGEPKRVVQQALDAACIAAQEDNWDGTGSARVEPSTHVYANQFLRILPDDLPVPDISVDTDGEILFEWDRGPRQIFSVSIGRDGTLTFAGLFGQSKIHGTEHLREALPLVIAHSLQRVARQLTA
ncbi:MAG: hypothetical protein HYU46_14485 [Deltaproteobacteria bacterium]|nr:hypothetical protein [Deltaproteobacteria bacterium]